MGMEDRLPQAGFVECVASSRLGEILGEAMSHRFIAQPRRSHRRRRDSLKRRAAACLLPTCGEPGRTTAHCVLGGGGWG
jgi:hypothetical protein